MRGKKSAREREKKCHNYFISIFLCVCLGTFFLFLFFFFGEIITLITYLVGFRENRVRKKKKRRRSFGFLLKKKRKRRKNLSIIISYRSIFSFCVPASVILKQSRGNL